MLNLCMLGRVRSTEKCPSCGRVYYPLVDPSTRHQFNVLCRGACCRRPRSWYVDGRGIRDRHGAVGRLHRDPRRGIPFSSFVHAYRILEAIRLEIDEGRFDSRRWAAKKKGEYRVEPAMQLIVTDPKDRKEG